MLIPQEETLIIIKEYKKKCNCNKEYSWNHIVHMRLTEKSQFWWYTMFFFFFPKEKGDFRPKEQRVKIWYEKYRNIYEVNQRTERKRESWKPEMESTNSPLMKSLVNLMVGILTKDSKLLLLWLPISDFFLSVVCEVELAPLVCGS